MWENLKSIERIAFNTNSISQLCNKLGKVQDHACMMLKHKTLLEEMIHNKTK